MSASITTQQQTGIRAFGQTVLEAAARAIGRAPRAQGGSIGQDASQSTASGLVSDFAIDRFATALTRIPDPDDVLKRVGLKRHDLRRLEFDDEVGGALDTRREAAITSSWRIEGDNSESAQAKFVEEEVRRVFYPAMAGFWQAVPYGYSVSEAIYERREQGGIGFARVSVKPMQWFEPMRDGRLVMEIPGKGSRVELDKTLKFCLVARNATYQNPLGEALLSRLYWAWYFRHAGWKAWMQFVDRFGDPFVVTKSSDPQALVQGLLAMGVKNVVGVGTEDSIQVMLQTGDATFDRLDQRLTERIAKMILGQTLTSGNGNGAGSYALGQVHEAVRQDKRVADTRLMQDGGQWLVNALWAVNGFGDQPPKFVFADDADIQTERASRDVSLAGAGLVKFSKDYLLRAYSFEDGDIEVPEGAPPAAASPPGKPQPAKKLGQPEHTPRKAGRKEFTPAQQRVEDLGGAALGGTPQSPLSIDDIKAAVLGAKDAADLEDRLSMLLEKQSPEFAATLERALFAADVLGYIHAEEGD